MAAGNAVDVVSASVGGAGVAGAVTAGDTDWLAMENDAISARPWMAALCCL